MPIANMSNVASLIVPRLGLLMVFIDVFRILNKPYSKLCDLQH